MNNEEKDTPPGPVNSITLGCNHYDKTMRNFLFHPTGVSMHGFAVTRIITGILLIYHGVQVFDSGEMSGYGTWLNDLGFPVPALMAYLGKGSELVGGVCLVLGVFTRLASIIVILTMAGITFGMGHAKIFTDDQHPFLFILLGLIFFFAGPGPWSLDDRIFGSRS
jgi:putative oxidoreductase